MGQKWCVTKTYERWFLMKMCVKDGVGQRYEWKMECNNVINQR